MSQQNDNNNVEAFIKSLFVYVKLRSIVETNFMLSMVKARDATHAANIEQDRIRLDNEILKVVKTLQLQIPIEVAKVIKQDPTRTASLLFQIVRQQADVLHAQITVDLLAHNAGVINLNSTPSLNITTEYLQHIDHTHPMFRISANYSNVPLEFVWYCHTEIDSTNTPTTIN